MMTPLVWLIISASVTGNAQHVQATDTLPAVKQHPLATGCETAFIITDRQTYIAGENVWYSMLVMGGGEREIPRSIAGYAEILNSSGLPVSQSRIPLESGGTGNGLLPLPDTISSGDYVLRGYTRAMTPYGPESFFTRIIRVFNPYSLATGYTRVRPERGAGGPGVALFPEGDALLPGQSNKVIIRTTGRDGSGKTARVAVHSGSTHVSDTVTTDMNGLASALITPDEGGTISASAVIDSVLTKAEIPRHRVAPQSISVNEIMAGTVRIKVRHTTWPGRNLPGTLHLAVICPGRICYYRQLSPVPGDNLFDIPSDSLGPGINEALLFDQNGNLLSSRLFLNSHQEENRTCDGNLQLTAANDTIRVTAPASASTVTISASMADESILTDYRSLALLSEWVAASALAEPFPDSFLSVGAGITDDLLITMSDRHLQFIGNPMPGIVAETRGLSVSGSLDLPDNQGPAAGKPLFINIPGKECFLRCTRSDEEGKFNFIVLPRRGTGEIVIYPQDTTEDMIIRIASPYHEGSIPFHSSVTDISAGADETVLRLSVNSQVMRVYQIRETDTAAVTERTAPPRHFYGTEGQHLNMSEYIALPNMEEIFFELIQSVDLVKTRTGYIFRMFDQVTGSEIKVAPLMFIDGTCTSDPGTIAGVSPDITEYIDVVMNNYRAGEILLPPVVSVVTKKGDYRMQSLPAAVLRISYLFTDPDVSFRVFAGDPSGRMPRFGNTLLWAVGKDPGQSFSIPRPDYHRPVTVRLTITGRERQPCFINKTIYFSRTE